MPKRTDPEMVEFETALLRSLQQARNGQYARIHTPDEIARRSGQPDGDETPAQAKQPGN